MRKPAQGMKCRHCGYVFLVDNPEYAWMAGVTILGGCPSCGHRLETGVDIIGPAMPSDPEKRANICTPDPGVAS